MKHFLSLLFIFISYNYLYSQSCIEIGSSKKEVRKVQGIPTAIHKYDALGIEVWDYELSSITFKKERMDEYENIQHNLRLCGEDDKSINSNNINKPTIYELAKLTQDNHVQSQGIPTDLPVAYSRYSDIPLNNDEVQIAKERGIDLSHITYAAEVGILIANDKAQRQEEYLIIGIGILCVFLIISGIFLWIRR